MSVAPVKLEAGPQRHVSSGDSYRAVDRQATVYIRHTDDDGRPAVSQIMGWYSALPGRSHGEPYWGPSSLEISRDLLPRAGSLGGYSVRKSDSAHPHQVDLAIAAGQALDGVLLSLGDAQDELPRFARRGIGSSERIAWGQAAADGDLLIKWSTRDARPNEDPVATTGSFVGNLADLPAASAQAIESVLAAWPHLSRRI